MTPEAEIHAPPFPPGIREAADPVVATAVAVRVPWSPLRIALIRSAGVLGLGFLLLLGAWSVRGAGSAAWGLAAAALAFYGASSAGGALRGAGRVGLRLRPRTVVAGAVLFLTNVFFLVAGAVLAMNASSGMVYRGRQLRRGGRVLLPPLRSGDAWSRARGDELAPASLDVPAAWRDAVAAQWRENARTEHASVAAFARLTLDLIELGAPPELVAAAHRDGLDEVGHARTCLSLAAAIDGRHASPGPFAGAASGALGPSDLGPRLRLVALAKLAVESLVDGALHEGVSARVLARLAPRVHLREIRESVSRIAADEGRHAAHGWHVVLWCVEQGGQPVLRALAGAAALLPRTRASSVDAAAGDGSWERWGIHGRELETIAYARTRAHLARRLAALRGRSRPALRGRSALGIRLRTHVGLEPAPGRGHGHLFQPREAEPGGGTAVLLDRPGE